MSRTNSALATACCALLLAAPLALAQSAAADSISSTSNTGTNGPTTPQEAAACKAVTSALLGGFGSMLGSAVCVVQPPRNG
ncbi:hypothetical protein [Streptomyces sp. FH025]|uniref:hypothetical protein n=1 Tax=Streptomyces sp. FH025 TaxID=2815937 RepID=UPI001A9F814F|nr:hypothetical protein [Streptomyces sp. FH025]MBO1416299.1 hypothetical protein [Streptomyces sp. FH025]